MLPLQFLCFLWEKRNKVLSSFTQWLAGHYFPSVWPNSSSQKICSLVPIEMGAPVSGAFLLAILFLQDSGTIAAGLAVIVGAWCWDSTLPPELLGLFPSTVCTDLKLDNNSKMGDAGTARWIWCPRAERMAVEWSRNQLKVPVLMYRTASAEVSGWDASCACIMELAGTG